MLAQDYIPALKDFFVAEVEGLVVGCCALEVYSKKIAEVRSLAVHKGFQGEGIAKELVRTCITVARKRGVKALLAITGAVKLFDKLGFGTFQEEKYAMRKML